MIDSLLKLGYSFRAHTSCIINWTQFISSPVLFFALFVMTFNYIVNLYLPIYFNFFLERKQAIFAFQVENYVCLTDDNTTNANANATHPLLTL